MRSHAISSARHRLLIVGGQGRVVLHDPALPAAPALLDRETAAELLKPAVEAAGGRLIAATPRHAGYRRGRRLVVRYAVEVAGLDGTRRRDTYGALVDKGELPAESTIVSDGAGTRVGVWAYPGDPFLPGLPAAASPPAVRCLLAELGGPDGPVQITPRVYRPTSRAVLAATGAGAACYLKVLTPGRVESLHAIHETLHGTLPIPASHGYAGEQAILVLEALRGESLAAGLSRGGRVPPPEALLDVLHRMASAPTTPGARIAPAKAFADHATTLALLLPDQAARAHAIAGAADDGWVPDRTVHGDFYEGQLLIDGERVTGLLDVDGLRPGDDLDDVATLVAHLDVLAWARPGAAAHIRAYRDGVIDAVARRLPTARLRRRVSGTLLGLAGWPFRAQRQDWQDATRQLLDVAERWLPAHRAA